MIFPRELHRFYKNPLKLLLKESNYLCIITFTERLVRTHPFSYNPLCRYWFDQQIVLSIRFQIYNPASQAMNDIATKRSYFNTTLVIYIENNINMGRQLITHHFITGTADNADNDGRSKLNLSVCRHHYDDLRDRGPTSTSLFCKAVVLNWSSSRIHHHL